MIKYFPEGDMKPQTYNSNTDDVIEKMKIFRKTNQLQIESRNIRSKIIIKGPNKSNKRCNVKRACIFY